jgi:hypothetical protein
MGVVSEAPQRPSSASRRGKIVRFNWVFVPSTAIACIRSYQIWGPVVATVAAVIGAAVAIVGNIWWNSWTQADQAAYQSARTVDAFAWFRFRRPSRNQEHPKE